MPKLLIKFITLLITAKQAPLKNRLINNYVCLSTWGFVNAFFSPSPSF